MKNLPDNVHPPELHYHKLEKNHIRVINVQPGDDDDMLELNLMRCPLGYFDKPDSTYAPVSYRWIANDEQVPALMDGQVMMISRNLDQLIRNARTAKDSGSYRTLWIDQLCINQDDPEDKAQQIPLMRAIYENAAGSIVWLGDDPAMDCELAFSLIDRWQKLDDDPDIDSGKHLDKLPLDVTLGPPTPKNLEAYAALRTLLNYDYWDRTWVLQEATAHIGVSFLYGRSGQSRRDLMDLRRVFYARSQIMYFAARGAPSIYRFDDTSSSRVGRLELFNEMRTDTRPHPLFDWLGLVRRTACSDARDKIYSVLPFAADVGDYTEDQFLKPSYSRPAPDVYIDVARWHICNKKNLDVIGYCSSNRNWPRNGHFYVPSWVPNWNDETHMLPMPKTSHSSPDDEVGQPMYSAAGPHSHVSQLVFPPLANVKTHSLFLSGLRVASICKVLDPVVDNFVSLQVEKSWQDSIDPAAIYPLTGETMLDAFQKTLLMDCELLPEQQYMHRRGGRLVWPTSPSDHGSFVRQTSVIKRITRQRRLFYAHAIHTPRESCPTQLGADGAQFIIGLGRDDVQAGDTLWSFKGGSVLYVLRFMGTAVKPPPLGSAADPPSGNPFPDQLWFNGDARDQDPRLICGTYQIVGEAYAHGLMDGEAVKYAAQSPDERPPVLREMASEFTDTLVGGKYWMKKHTEYPGFRDMDVPVYDLYTEEPEADTNTIKKATTDDKATDNVETDEAIESDTSAPANDEQQRAAQSVVDADMRSDHPLEPQDETRISPTSSPRDDAKANDIANTEANTNQAPTQWPRSMVLTDNMISLLGSPEKEKEQMTEGMLVFW